ncbi:NAD(P)-binding domain-containing protein [Enterococcus sp. BWB1-3]|uniref:pyrroline-5-carboxylate reductase family protein n=1 Tax=Enterococcus sp. BWB1-3 TaxID=2787713 RepID=UPI0019207FC3|nr:NAD(P)-binding domain-containing protein [Enterococcus sp. BWB1-3]MBL1230071.1 NAD(P)-binding domain-containing protein [Enterococcus sp. BWB1-3]
MNKIGFIGLGNMAEKMLNQLSKQNFEFLGLDNKVERAYEFSNKYGIKVKSSLAELMDEASFIILSVRPDNVCSLANEMKKELRRQHIIISICAGLSIKDLASYFPNNPVVRSMPNGIEDSRGYSALCFDKNCSKEQILEVRKLFQGIGEIVILEEQKFASFTAFSCASPVVILKLIEYLLQSGTYLGFTKKQSLEIVTANLLSCIELTNNGDIGKQVEKLCSPGGIGVEMLHTFSQGLVKKTLIDAFIAGRDKDIYLLKGEDK